MKKDWKVSLAEKATAEIYKREPALLSRFGEKGKAKCLEDNEHHIKQLETALLLDNKQFFIDYAIWLNGILTKHGMNSQHLIDNFTIIQQLLMKNGEEENERGLLYLDEAVLALQQ
ncbi:hypothetical protein AC623_01195 [Bacillus sp. FJAT-27231]|uniref:hypothetical protein n=1 Tax=Bacillus sp. FJAT-27231 TaxID=1679168 RepID=UPI0006709850|nr:hypothetical protein [Bacillus sp. FJAT-27231]KMY52773.1 hypothetical protein AC623_01195 [Bacillus sp. FJAT-27231]